MFEGPGTIYVYFTYGMHWMLNIVTEEKDFPSAILIRGTDQISGPARLTKALKIDKSLNGKKLGRESGLWIEDKNPSLQAVSYKLIRTPRIGVTYAKEWAEKPYRFILVSDDENYPNLFPKPQIRPALKLYKIRKQKM